MKKILLLLTASLFFSFYINAAVIANFTCVQTSGGCSPDSVVFTNTSTGASTYQWDFGDFSPTVAATDTSHVYMFSGAFVITLTAYDGLGDSSIFRKAIVVKDGVIFAFFIMSSDTVCLGDSVRFQNFGFPATSICLWTFGDGDSATSIHPKHTYKTAGTFYVMLYIDNGCAIDSMLDSVVVNTAKGPFASFSSSATFACPGERIDFTNYSTHLAGSSWDFGDGNTATTVHGCHSYSGTGPYIVTLIDTNGCGADTVTTVITISTGLIPSIFSSASADTICPGESVSFSSFGTGLVSFLWDLGDGTSSVQQFPSHTYNTLGTYTITVIATNACDSVDMDTMTVVVDSSVVPIAFFFASPSSFVCPGTLLSFFNSSTGIDSSIWDFGDGDSSTLTYPTHTYTVAGSYTVTLITFNSCGNSDTTFSLITVDPNIAPFAAFGVPPFALFPTIVCPNTNVEFRNFSSSFTSSFWDFGDGDTSTLNDPTHVFTAAGDYAVTLSVTNDCGNEHFYANAVCVGNCAGPDIGSLSSTPSIACVGEGISFSQFGSVPANYAWDFGDGNVDSSEFSFNTYSTAGEFKVRLIAYNSCGADTGYIWVQIKESPGASFTCDTVCLGDSTTFTDTSTPAATRWAWDFGDGGTSFDQNPKHLFTSGGSFTVQLKTTNANGCDNYTSKVVDVNPALTADAGTDTSICIGDSIQLMGSGGLTYSWSPGGSLSNPKIANPMASPTTTTTYTLSITDSITCSEIDLVIITVYSLPVITINNDTTICAPDSAQLLATGGGTYSWLPVTGLDNPAIANPKASPSSTTTYTVTVIDGNGCTSSDSTIVTVIQPVIAGFTMADTGLIVTFTNTSGGTPVSWHWDFGDGDTSVLQNPMHTYAAGGSYQVCLIVTNSCGSDTFCDSTGVITFIPIANNLAQNLTIYPNPFIGETQIEYSLDVSSNVQLSVYDELGKLIETLVDQKQAAGTYKVIFKTDDYKKAAGVYFMKFVVNDQAITTRLIELR